MDPRPNQHRLLQSHPGLHGKTKPTVRWVLCWRYVFSQSVTRQVSSAQMSLTSVFGMGTGGPSSQSTPTIYDNKFPWYRLIRRSGDPYRIRTDVKGVRGLCLNHLTNGPCLLIYIKCYRTIYLVRLHGLEPGTH